MSWAVTVISPAKGIKTIGDLVRNSGSDLGFVFDSEIRCVPHGASGTRLEMEVRGRATNLVAKLLSPLFAIFSRMMVKQCAKDLADIAAAAERRG